MMGGSLSPAILASFTSSLPVSLLTHGSVYGRGLHGGYQLAYAVGALFTVIAAVIDATLIWSTDYTSRKFDTKHSFYETQEMAPICYQQRNGFSS